MKTVNSWAVKYRPQTFDDVVGQTSAVSILRGSIRKQELPNALFISGPFGTGKTTLARIYARVINCAKGTGCGKCDSCKASIHPDIQEEDAAISRGIDEMRALIAKTKYRPRHNVRVFIIDEAHQLTPQAMQAFLKTLEEPPKNTMFILCTTDPQKFAKTILSRCTIINLRMPTADDIIERLRIIAKAENVKLSKSLALAIAEASGGHIRDAINMLNSVDNQLADNPEATQEELIATIQGGTNEEIAAVCTKLLLGMYLNKPVAIAKAVFAAGDATQTVNQAIWFNEYHMAQLMKSDTRAVFHSPANRTFHQTAKQHASEVKLSGLLAAQRKLVALRNTLHTVSTKETSLMLAMLT